MCSLFLELPTIICKFVQGPSGVTRTAECFGKMYSDGFHYPCGRRTEPLVHRDCHANENIRIIQMFTQGIYFYHPKRMALNDVGLGGGGVGSGDQLHTVPHLHRWFSLGARPQRRAPSSCNFQRDSSATSRLSLHSQRYRVGAVDTWYVHAIHIIAQSFTTIKQRPLKGSYFFGPYIRPCDRQCASGGLLIHFRPYIRPS